MPLPKSLARFNRTVTNKVTMPIARLAPGFGVVVHVGRRSGRTYRTPVNAFRTPRGYVIALTYGADSDWLRNVLAAGGCTLLNRGTAVRLVNPHVSHTPPYNSIPPPVRLVLRLIQVEDVLELDAGSQSLPPAPG